MKKMIIKFVLVFLLFPLNSLTSSAQVTEWVSINPGMGVDVCLDQFQNTYTCGQFVGTSNIGSYTFTSAGAQDVVIEKYDPSGALLWAVPFGGTQSEFSNKIIYDGLGSVWVTGQFSGTMNVGSFTLVSAGGSDGFVVKLDASSGTIVFAQRFGGTGNDVGTSIKEDFFGNIFLSGTFYGNFNYGSLSLTSLGSMDVFLIKLDNTGLPTWGKSIGGTSTETTWSMTTDIFGNVYVAGFSSSATSYFSGVPVNYTSYTQFVAKFDNIGNYVWSTSVLGNGEVYALCTDAAGSVYFTGNYDTQIIIGLDTLIGVGNDEILLVKINNNGTFAWAKSYGGTGADGGYGIDCNAQGDVFLVGIFRGSFTFGNTPLNAGSFTKSFLAKIDSAGTVKWVLPTRGSASSHVTKGVTIGNSGDIYLTGSGGGVLNIGTFSVTLSGAYLVKVADNANIIQGTVFNDINNDGIFDVGESGIPNVILNLNNSPYVTASNNIGVYEMYTNSGNHSVSIPNLPLYHSLTTPASLTSNFVGMGNMDTARHFGLYPMPNVNDLRIDITPVSSPKAGHVLSYLITYTNVGTTTLNASVTLQPDPTTNYFYAAPSPSSQVGQTFTWNIGTLAPQANGTIHVHFNIPTTHNIGDLITAVAGITPLTNDTTPNNNTQTSVIAVVGPYDPNYKEVDVDTLYNVSNAGWLNYTVHFQNVGNDSAVNVIIIDTLSQYLDLPSFEIIASSHQPMTFNINNGNVAEFRFNNIMLPDSATDPIGSQGFVKYRIKYLNTLPLNNAIKNFADIYFDYNAAVRTDTAFTYYTNVTTINDIEKNEHGVILYPNPTSHELNIVNAQLLNKIAITDITGKTLKTITSNLNLIDVADLPTGIYFIQLVDDEKTTILKFVKQ